MVDDTLSSAPPKGNESAVVCPLCGNSLWEQDFSDMGLRPPAPGEGPEEYCEAELLDVSDLRHQRCPDGDVTSRRASRSR